MNHKRSLFASVQAIRRSAALWRIYLLCSLVVFVLTACSYPAPTVGKGVDFTSACERANDGKRVAVVGYLRLPDSFKGDSSVMLRLYATDGFDSPPIGVQTHFGTEANQVEQVADEYLDTDLKVHLSGGSVAEFGTRVKVSGKVYYPLVDQDFECGLENPLVELAH